MTQANTEKLVALVDIRVSTGILQNGTTFEVLKQDVEEYIRSGRAVRLTDHAVAGWNGLNWSGKKVVILASGPSLSQAQADCVRTWREASDQHRVIVVNLTFRRAPYADILYACDGAWWNEFHKEASNTCTGTGPFTEFWTQDEEAVKKYDLKYIRSITGPGMCTTLGMIHQGMNSGYQAIGLAYQARASDIFLLGFDMRGKHWHAEYDKDHLNRASPFPAWLGHFSKLASDCKALGVNVVNCTSDTALTSFPQRDWQEVFQ